MKLSEEQEVIKEKIENLIDYCTYTDDFGHVVFTDWGYVEEFIDRLIMEFKL
jgi:ferritin